MYLLLPIWNLLIIFLQSLIIKNLHFSSKYIYDIYDFLIWQPVYLFFSYLAPWTFATIKDIYVILLATWHRYWSKWTVVPFTKENFNWMLDKEVQNF